MFAELGFWQEHIIILSGEMFIQSQKLLSQTRLQTGFILVLMLVPALLAVVVTAKGFVDGDRTLMVLGVASLLFYWPLIMLRKRTQQDSLSLEKILFDSRAMLDSAHDMIIQHKREGDILEVNEPTSKLLGYSRKELESLSFYDLDEQSTLKQDEKLAAKLRRGEPVLYEAEFRKRNSAKFPVEIRTRRADWMEPPRLISVVRDISEWRITEKALEDSRKSLERARNRLETRVHQRARELKKQINFTERAEDDVTKMRAFLYSMIDSMPSIIIALDLRQRVTQWNQQAETVTGISSENAIGQPLTFLLPDFQQHISLFTEGQQLEEIAGTKRIEGVIGGEKRLLDVMIYSLQASGNVGVVVRVDDVTEKTRIENVLIQTEKMLSLGGLAAGMAHEINNPLGAILQSNQNLRRRLGSDLKRNLEVADEVGLSLEAFTEYSKKQKLDVFIDTIDEAGKRAATIVEDMLSFARPAGQQDQELDIIELLDASVRLAQSDYSTKKNYDFRNITILKDYAEGVPIVSGRKTRLQQVFLNLLTNAAQALSGPDVIKPTITLLISIKGHEVVIEVIDNGPGMTEEMRKRVFEPFFTTKKEGAGTGLGLSVSYFIVTEQMDGAMEVFAKPAKGARFVIRLPFMHQPQFAKDSVEEQSQQYTLPLQPGDNQAK